MGTSCSLHCSRQTEVRAHSVQVHCTRSVCNEMMEVHRAIENPSQQFPLSLRRPSSRCWAGSDEARALSQTLGSSPWCWAGATRHKLCHAHWKLSLVLAGSDKHGLFHTLWEALLGVGLGVMRHGLCQALWKALFGVGRE